MIALGVLGLAAAVAVVAWTLLSSAPRAEADTLRRALRFYTGRKADPVGREIGFEEFKRMVVDLVGMAPKPSGYEEKLRQLLERAAWPIRPAEFIALRAGAATVTGLLVFAIAGSKLLPVLGAGLAWAAPGFALRVVVQRRASAFLAQLPDTLQLVAASLEAGYGILQALDTVVKEAAPPASLEFARALSEIRLGASVQDALQATADRVGGEDLQWVVMAISIQREIGGNLASLLKTVAETLREREQVRRSVQVLSAEGRLSAVVLTGLPFLIGAYMMLVNPTYIGVLTGSPFGRVMLGGAVSLIAVGVVWMRKMIRIEV